MNKLPKDCDQRTINTEARKLVFDRFSSLRWDFHEETGGDYGRDCVLELIENGQCINRKIEGQIKGTRKIHFLRGENAITFPLPVKTINYGLNSQVAFVLFLADVDKRIVYYLPLQDYFISNPNLFNKLETNKETLNVHIPHDNIVSYDDFELQQIAKSTYIGAGRKLRREYC